MITLLEKALEHADGAYLDPQDLQDLDRIMQSWAIHRQTYELLQTNERQIVETVIAQLGSVIIDSSRLDANVIEKCRRDMTAVLRSCATAMLLQDPELLKDRFLYWMQNIMQAMQRQKTNAVIYQLLQQTVSSTLPSQNAAVFIPYLQLAREWLS